MLLLLALIFDHSDGRDVAECDACPLANRHCRKELYGILIILSLPLSNLEKLTQQEERILKKKRLAWVSKVRYVVQPIAACVAQTKHASSYLTKNQSTPRCARFRDP
jgi:hypothetical protein